MYLGIAEAARLVGVSTSTLRHWERLGLVQPERTPTGQRRFTLEDVQALRQIRQLREDEQLSLSDIREALDHAADESDGCDRSREPIIDWRAKLKHLRAKAGLSLRDVGARTGLSPSFISSIERGKANPSVAALQKLTVTYGTSIVELMGGTEQSPLTLVRPEDRKVYDASVGVTIEQLDFGPHRMELHIFRVEPGAGTGSAYQHEGEEFIFMIEGELIVWLDQVERYHLRAGDVLYFESMRLHEWVNPGSTTTVFLGVNTPPTF